MATHEDLRSFPPLTAPLDADAGDLVLEGPRTFRVRGEAYTSSGIYERECEQIFESIWICVGHESEIPQRGDFKTSYVGRQPVIVVRGDGGDVSVLLNRCVHRGSVVCRERAGNTTGFSCPYHGWSYSKDGTLVGIPMQHEAGGYADDFDAPSGLLRVRSETYRGLIFATFNPAGPTLREHLGRAALFIDRRFNRSPQGLIELASDPYVVVYKGNWKFQAENIVDGYHFLFVHQGFAKLQGKYGDSTGDFGVHKGGSAAEMRKIRTAGVSFGCPQGHGLAETPAPDPDDLLSGEFGAYYRELLDVYGPDEFKWITGSGTSSIFPSLGIIHHQIRTWRPLAADLTEVTVYPFKLTGAPDAFNEGWLRSQERFYGPSGYGMTDDVEVFSLNQQGLQGTVLPWTILERGMHTEETGADGLIHGKPMGETQQRAFWRRWKQIMASGDAR
jgi:benzoate/toluate 1,2-dioxygenase alpha subunit